MCEEREHLEARIQRYCKIAQSLTVERITGLIQELRQRREAMHYSVPSAAAETGQRLSTLSPKEGRPD